MSRKSRLLYPVVFLLRLTEAQNDQADAIAKHYKVRRAEAIRRCIEAQYVILFSNNSTDATIQSTERIAQ